MESIIEESGVVYLLDVPFEDKSLESIGLPSILEELPKKLELVQKEGYYNVGWSNQLHRIIENRNIKESEVNRFKESDLSD